MVDVSDNLENKSTTSGETFCSKAGYGIFLSDAVWRLDKDVDIPVSKLSELLGDNLLISCISVLRFYSNKYSASHVQNIFYRFLYFLRVEGFRVELTTASIISYRSILTRETEWYLGTIRGFLKKWYGLGYEGVGHDVVELLDGWRIKGNIKGDVVKRLDPLKGPLSDIELTAFNEGAVQSYEKNLITLDELAMSLMSSATGRRQIQISHMKVKDLLQGQNYKGEPAYILNIPRAKQRGASFRSELKPYQISKEIWLILTAQVSAVTAFFQNKFAGDSLKNTLIAELPLFPNYKAILSLNGDRSELKNILELDVLHVVSSAITASVKNVVEMAGVHSERTGEELNITSTRFRYTIGTRAAREGYGSSVIAELLDHEDNQNAHVYVENVPEYAARISEKIGHLMAPYARAFAGNMVDSEKSARRGNDLSSRIKVSLNENIGTCGSYDFCGSRVPIPCYTCHHFQPWLEAPHQEVLDDLIYDRNRIKELTGDLAVASINDRTIFAITEVIQRCHERKKELGIV